jgi:hypothetical protein
MLTHNQIRQLKSGSLEIRLFSFELFYESEGNSQLILTGNGIIRQNVASGNFIADC